MSWLWDAAQQAASGDFVGAAETASQGAKETADEVAGAVGGVMNDAAEAMGFGTGSTGGGSGSAPAGTPASVVEQIFRTLEDMSGGNLSEVGDHLGAAFDAASSGDLLGAAESAGAAAGSGLEGVGKGIATVVDTVDESTGGVMSRTAEAVFDGLDSATDGKMSDTFEHARTAARAALAGDFVGAANEGAAAVGSGVQGGAAVVKGAAGGIGGAVAKVDEATGGHLGRTAEQVGRTVDDITGGKLDEGVEHARSAMRAAASGDIDSAAKEGAAAAGAFGEGAANVVEGVFDTADRSTGGRLGGAREGLAEAGRRAAEGDFEGAAEVAAGAASSLLDAGTAAAEAGLDQLDTTTRALGERVRGAITSVDEATGGTLSSASEWSLGAVASDLVTETFEAVDAATEGRLSAARDGLVSAGERAAAGDFEGALDAAGGAQDELALAAAELVEKGVELLDDTTGASEAIESVTELIEEAGARAEDAAARAEDDPESAAADAHEAVVAYTEVTARMGAATAVALDEATGSALSSSSSAVERARAELADGRYDDALAELERAAGQLGRVPSLMPDVGADELIARLGEARRVDEVRAEGHERLGTVVDAVVRRIPPSDDPAPDLAAPVAVDDPIVDALTDSHLGRAAALIRRAASPDGADGSPDRNDSASRAAAIEEADAHLLRVGPAAATSLVATIDEKGHLGDTVGLTGRAVRALRDGDYEGATAIAPRLSERLTRSMDELSVQPDGLTGDAALAGDDLTDGHTESALRHLDEALAHEARGEEAEAALEARAAAEEYDAAIVSYERNVDRVVEALVEPNAPEPVRARVLSVLDTRSEGALSQARSALERGAVDARAGDLGAALERGNGARAALAEARSAYQASDTPARLADDLRVALAGVDSGEHHGGGPFAYEPVPSVEVEADHLVATASFDPADSQEEEGAFDLD